MTWMGVDYGEARVGVALYDSASPLAAARPLGTVVRKGRRQVLERLAALAREHSVSRVIVGIPLAPDGGVGLRASQARNFARDLERETGLPTVLQDERDSTHEALERLIAAGVPMKKRAERIDEMAAVVILERFAANEREGSRSVDDSR